VTRLANFGAQITRAAPTGGFVRLESARTTHGDATRASFYWPSS